MDTRGRKLFRCVAGFITAVVLMGAAYTTTAMASSIGLIDTAELLDIYAEAYDSSEVVGQVMDEGHVAILTRDSGWVQIQAGDIVGWVPDANLIETEVSNEEAVEANQEVIEEMSEQAEETGSEAHEEEFSEEEAVTEEKQAEEGTAEEETVTDEAEETTADAAEGTGADATEETTAVAAEETAPDETEETAAAQAQQSVEAESVEAFARNQEIAAQAFLEAQQRAQQEAAAIALVQAQQEAAALQAQQEASRLQAEAEAGKQAILAANGVTEEDLYLLANIIYCEAGCEPYIGKVAVGNVVMNRVRSDHQPDTISEVIYAKGQFSPVRNGSLARALKNGSADESCYQAALEALAGSRPVGDKLYFRRVNGRSGQVIGHHVFY